MAAVGDDVCVSEETKIDSLQENVKNLCPCCEKVKNDLQKLQMDVKTLEEIVKIMKEDRAYLLARLDTNECGTGKRVNSVTNRNSKVIPPNDWKTISNSKRSTKPVPVKQQEFRIPTVINRYTILENLQEENQFLNQHHRNQLVKVKKTKAKIVQ
jgi:hypothetical protein